jgi:hypothetical protein
MEQKRYPLIATIFVSFITDRIRVRVCDVVNDKLFTQKTRWYTLAEMDQRKRDGFTTDSYTETIERNCALVQVTSTAFPENLKVYWQLPDYTAERFRKLLKQYGKSEKDYIVLRISKGPYTVSDDHCIYLSGSLVAIG